MRYYNIESVSSLDEFKGAAEDNTAALRLDPNKPQQTQAHRKIEYTILQHKQNNQYIMIYRHNING